MLTKRIEKKLDGNCTRMLQAILSKSWQQCSTKQQLYSHLPLISKTIQIRRTRHVGHCWKTKDKLKSNVLLWIPSHGHANVGRPAWTYLKQLCTDTGCSLEDLPEVMDDRGGWQERFREICVSRTPQRWDLLGYIDVNISCMYFMYVLNVLICVNELILLFLPYIKCSWIIGFTNSNTGSW